MPPPDTASGPFNPKYLSPAVQFLLGITGLAALFYLLTNGVPLVQLGWLHDLGKKSRYVRPMLISVSVFTALMFLAWWKCRPVFERSFWVRLWGSLSRVPLRYSTAVLFILYAAMMTVVGFERHLAVETRAFDLGIFAQAVWNTLHGDILFSSIKENINLMGDHVSPILLAAVPFYAIWQDPRTLVLLQAIAAASSFFPLALIARDKLKDRSIVLIFLLMFFFFQPMRAALHEDFHPEVLAEPFLWWAFYFLQKRQTKWFVLALLAAAAGKENFLGVTFFLGLYAFIWERMRILGILVMLGSAGLFILETKWLVPHLTGTKYYYGGNYSIALSDPVNGIIKKLFNLGSAEYVLKVFLPFLFLPFFHLPTLILVFPVLLQNLLSANSAMLSFNYHYLTGMTPFLFISTICALASLPGKWPRFRAHAPKIAFALLAAALLRSGPSEYWFFWNIHSHRTPHTEMLRQKLAGIPPEARVLTHNSFVPQLCNRKYVYQFNYNLVPTKIDQAKNYRADYLAWDLKYWEPNSPGYETTLADAKAAGYTVIFEKDGFSILRAS